jgi:hypothetical protein
MIINMIEAKQYKDNELWYNTYKTPEDFNYKYYNNMLANMYNVITDLELWEDVKEKIPDKNKGFMFSKLDWVDKVMSHPKIIEDGHSGSSASLCLRHMEYIAKNNGKIFKDYSE